MTVPAKTAQKPDTDYLAIRRELLTIVNESKKRLTPAELEKSLYGKFPFDREMFKSVVKDLVLEQEFVYTYQFGCTFLEKSYNRPIRISKQVILKPPGTHYRSGPKDIVIEIQQGASFGSGEHPTTRLAIQGIETVLSGETGFGKADETRALDIGTGSGVLALAAVLLGIGSAVGIDIDPCARAEAKQNVQLNNLGHRIEIRDDFIEEISGTFSLITANLRYPTLKRFCPRMVKILDEKGTVVVSGVKTDEVRDLLYCFIQNRFRCVWKSVEKGWVGMVFNQELS